MATWKLDADGLPIEYTGNGNDYMKAPVEERFEIKDGKASWKNRSEKGEQAVTGKAFYLPMNAPPEIFGVLARALLKAPNHKLALLRPAKRASKRGQKVDCRQRRADRSIASPGLGSPRNDLARPATATGGVVSAGSPSCSTSIRSGYRAIAGGAGKDRCRVVDANSRTN